MHINKKWTFFPADKEILPFGLDLCTECYFRFPGAFVRRSLLARPPSGKSMTLTSGCAYHGPAQPYTTRSRPHERKMHIYRNKRTHIHSRRYWPNRPYSRRGRCVMRFQVAGLARSKVVYNGAFDDTLERDSKCQTQFMLFGRPVIRCSSSLQCTVPGLPRIPGIPGITGILGITNYGYFLRKVHESKSRNLLLSQTRHTRKPRLHNLRC
jgi:hypothetical protein